MKTNNYFLVSLIIILIMFVSCNNEKNDILDEDIINNTYSNQNTSPIKNNYATGFKIISHNSYKEVVVYNPWQGAGNIKYKYILINEGEKYLRELDDNTQIINIPVKRVVCLSTTHIAYIDLLSETASIIGVSTPSSINNKKIKKSVEESKISNVGNDNHLNYEMIIKLKPDLVITYGVGTESVRHINKLKELGVNVVVIAEYLEETLLAKAEWLKFISFFYNKEEVAEKEFNIIKNEYNNLKKDVEILKNRPKVLAELPWKGVWYVPGGHSNIAGLINDAGGEYLWKNNKSKESIALSIESVYEKAQEADIWINIGSAENIGDILMKDERLSNLNVLKNNNIFNNNAMKNDHGGNDFWESGVVNPHIILKDLIHIFHPEIYPNYELVYYKKIGGEIYD